MYNYTYSTGEIFIYNNCVMNASELLECLEGMWIMEDDCMEFIN